MGSTKNVFLNDESTFLLEKIKKSDPDFNFSSFIQDCLMRFEGGKMEESDIMKKISSAEIKKKIAEDEIEYWNKKKDEIVGAHARMIMDAARLKQEAREHEKIVAFLDNMTDEQQEEFKRGVQEGRWNYRAEYARTKINEVKELEN